MHMASLRTLSIRQVLTLQHQTGMQSSDDEYIREKAAIHNVFASTFLTLRVALTAQCMISVFCANPQDNDGMRMICPVSLQGNLELCRMTASCNKLQAHVLPFSS